VFWFSVQPLSETFISRRTERGTITNEHMYSCKTRYYSQICIKIGYSQQIFEKERSINFQNICPVGAELFHADERTDGRTTGRNQ
jgi:hypothetical protein